ncbi:MAG: TOBE domain-containing protein [Nitrospinae bacterium]|nr:TOBE domain-containing protein [Nitrospinota bacterium]
MNTIQGTISEIRYSGEMYLVDVHVGKDVTLTAIAVGAEEGEEMLKKGDNVTLCFKSTELSIAKNMSGEVSLRNRLPSIVTKVKTGELLCQITLDFIGNSINSIITKRSAERIGVKTGDTVTGLIKANEVILLEKNDLLQQESF